MRSKLTKLTAAALLLLSVQTQSKAQVDEINVVTTAVPFLRISPDARSGGMGDLGLATSPDANAGFWNIGKVVFNESKGSIAASYTPWLKDLVNDVYLASLAGYYKVDEEQALNLGMRYFSLGNIQFTDGSGNSWGNGKPREFSVDLGYSRKLSEQLGLGIAIRYINSDLTNGAPSGNTTYKAGNSVAGDIGVYYDNRDEEGTGVTFGAALTNLGAKISYTNNADQKDFIPSNLGLGVAWNKAIDDQNKFMLGVDFNKLLVPAFEGDPSNPQDVADYRQKGVVSSWFSSFGDFPGQANLSIGGEYWYNDQFALRGGYFWEDKNRGNRRYFTAGAGLRYNVFTLNFSYLAPSGSGITRNPLSNTVRFSIIFDLDSETALD